MTKVPGAPRRPPEDRSLGSEFGICSNGIAAEPPTGPLFDETGNLTSAGMAVAKEQGWVVANKGGGLTGKLRSE